MQRLIDADMLEPSEVYMNYGFTRIVYMDDIDELPTVDAEPVRHGHWDDMGDFESCSVCNGTHLKEYQTYYGKCLWVKMDYCPHCGADMRAEHLDVPDICVGNTKMDEERENEI